MLKWSSRRYYDNTSFTTNNYIKAYHTKYLIHSEDGLGINYLLITGLNPLLNGRYFVDSIKLKIALLFTKFRSKKMFPYTNTKWLMRGCNYNYDCLTI